MCIDPNSDVLTYVPWKGTTIYRKTMNECNIVSIPREFINNTFTFGKGTINKLSKFSHAALDFDEGVSVQIQGHMEDRINLDSPTNTVKNSFCGDENPAVSRGQLNQTEMQDFELNDRSPNMLRQPKSLLQSFK